VRRLHLYLLLLLFTWGWYKAARWRGEPEDKWIRKAREGGYPLEPLRGRAL